MGGKTQFELEGRQKEVNQLEEHKCTCKWIVFPIAMAGKRHNEHEKAEKKCPINAMRHILGQKIPFQVHKSVENQRKNRENAEKHIYKLKLVIPQIIGKRRILPFYGTCSKANGEKQAEKLARHASSGERSTWPNRSGEDGFQVGSRGEFAKKAGNEGCGNRGRFGGFPLFGIFCLFLRLLEKVIEIPAMHLQTDDKQTDQKEVPHGRRSPRGRKNGGIFEERNDKKRLESVRVESGTAIGFQSENPIIGGILRLANERCLEEESKSQENSLQSQRNSEEIREKPHGRNREENEQKKHQKEGSQITSNEEEK